MATIITWAKTATDSRDGASATLSFDVLKPVRSLAAIARAIDGSGDSAVADYVARGILRPAAWNMPEHRVACWHGVTVDYGPQVSPRTFRAN